VSKSAKNPPPNAVSKDYIIDCSEANRLLPISDYLLNPQSPGKEGTKRKESTSNLSTPSPKKTKATSSRAQEETEEGLDDTESTPKQSHSRATPSSAQKSPQKHSPRRTQEEEPGSLTQRMNSVLLKSSLKSPLRSVRVVIDSSTIASSQTDTPSQSTSKLEKYYDERKKSASTEEASSPSTTPNRRRKRVFFSEEEHYEDADQLERRPTRQTALQRIRHNSQQVEEVEQVEENTIRATELVFVHVGYLLGNIWNTINGMIHYLV
jgi:hypothetical protein